MNFISFEIATLWIDDTPFHVKNSLNPIFNILFCQGLKSGKRHNPQKIGFYCIFHCKIKRIDPLVCLSVCLWVCFCVSLYVFRFGVCLFIFLSRSVHLSLNLNATLFYICVSFCPFCLCLVCLLMCLSSSLKNIHRSLCCMYVYLYICLFACLQDWRTSLFLLFFEILNPLIGSK